MVSTPLKLILAAATLALAAHGDRCMAAVAFNSFGPNDTYGSTGLHWQGSNFNEEVKLAQRFTPQISGQLSKLELGLSYSGQNGQSGDEITLAIVPDVDGKPGAAELWSQTYIDSVPFRAQNQGANSFSVSGGPLLQEGTKYWLTSTTPPSSGLHLWWLSPFPHEPYALYFIRGTFNQVVGEWHVRESPTWFGAPVYSHALRVSVVPEPAAAALMIAAIATFLAIRRRAVSL